MFQFTFNRRTLAFALSFLLSALTVTSTATAGDSPSEKTYAHFNEAGQLLRPSGYREWIFIGAPLTPNDMNNGKAAFPEFHNVYIDPVSWAHWKTTGEFRDGTIIVKELVSVGGKQAASGNGYFQGDYIGLEAMVRSKQHLPDADGHWGFFRYTIEHSDRLHKSAAAQPEENCMACHQSKAAKDQVFIQYYPVLRAAAGKGDRGTGR
ncbi:cytochrome P460 family protein [Methylomarinum sp. Ch1-1]|uniref:Cytochrome P460 family protein n=1 Tax=Methylomarinum roseum TaxID=3067653 RepID=A0AAU7NW53_9GAMM|nr:cytochrome P460 family protein [Methylomarinum sp. Ch1-1]MDP4522720.1 cytochrome P460 family protein [Methylomarinum sp. Ch1-1]